MNIWYRIFQIRCQINKLKFINDKRTYDFCKKCGGKGHTADICANKVNVCHWCGSPDHFKKDCKRLKSRGGLKARQLLVKLMEEFDANPENIIPDKEEIEEEEIFVDEESNDEKDLFFDA